MPDTKDFQTRLPPHVAKQLQDFIEDCSRHLKNKVSYSDMVGALILRARRQRLGLLDDLADYLDVLDSWKKDGSEDLPEL